MAAGTEIFRAYGTVSLEEDGDIQGRLNSMGSSATQAGGKLGKLTGVLAGVGVAAAATAAAVGVAVVGGLVTATQKADEFNDALGNLVTDTNTAEKDTKALGNTMKNVYKAGYGADINDTANAIKAVKQETKASGKELESYSKKLITLSNKLDVEYSEGMKTANILSKEFGVSIDEAFELMAQGQAKGLNKSGDMVDVLQEYSVQFAKSGLKAEEFFNVLIAGNEKGISDIDKLADMQKEFSIRAIDGSKSTKEAFDSLGLSYDEYSQKLAKGGEQGSEAQKKIMESLLSIEDPVKRAELGVALMGSTYEDLGDKAVNALSKTENGIDKTKNKMEELNKARFDTLGEKFEVIKRKLETEILLPLGEKIIPVIDNAIAGFETMYSAIKENIGNAKIVVDELINAFKDPEGAGEGLRKALENLLPEGFQEHINTIITLFNGFKENLTSIAGVIVEIFAPQIENIKNKFTEMDFTAVVEMFDRLKTVIVENLVPALNIIGQVIGGVVVTGFSLLFSIISGIVEAIPSLIATIMSVFEVVWNSISLLIESIIALFTGDFSKVEEIAGDLIESIIRLFENLGNTVINLITGLIDGIVSFFEGLGIDLGKIISDTVDSVVNWFKQLPGRIATVVSNLITSVSAKFTALKQMIVDKVKNIVSDAKTKFFEIVGKFAKVVGDMKKSVENKISDVKKAITGTLEKIDLYKIGKDIIQGLINGMGNLASSVAKKARSIADSITKTISGALIVKSPSRVMIGIGENVIQGLIIGLADDDLKTTLTNVSQTIIDSFFTVSNKVEEYFNKIRSSINNNLNKVKTDAISDINSMAKVIEEALQRQNKQVFEEQKKKDIETASKMMQDALSRKDTTAFDEAQRLAADAFNRKYIALTKEQIESQVVTLLGDKKGLQKILEKYYPDWQNVGQTVGEKIVNGLNSAKTSMTTAVSSFMDSVSAATSISIDKVSTEIDKVESKYQKVVDSLSKYINKINELKDKASSTTKKNLKESYTSEIQKLERLLASKASAYGLTYNQGKLYFPNNIQAFAGGVRDFAGGLGLVGEKGMELTYLPQGSNVFSNKETMNILENLAKSKNMQYGMNGQMQTKNVVNNIDVRVDFSQIESLDKFKDFIETLENEQNTRYSF